MAYQFQKNSQFVLLAVSNAYTDFPDERFQLPDGTWILPGVPVTDNAAAWETWLGSIRSERLESANLVLLVEEPSDTPWGLGAVHKSLSYDLGLLYFMLYLGFGVEILEYEGADRLAGSSVNGVPEILEVERMPRFYRSQGSPRVPITQDWLEGTLDLRAGFKEMEARRPQFRRIIRGLNTLSKGQREQTGQDRLHQFVRSLEALILPEKGKTRKQFAHRCQTFARAGGDTQTLLLEAFDMRSATEHLNRWYEPVQCYPRGKREAVCLKRTRQVERLACDAYSRLLGNPALREHFRTKHAIAKFWKLPDSRRCELWGAPLDVAKDLALGAE